MKKTLTLITLTLTTLLVSMISPVWAGSMNWSGRVDDNVNIVIRGRNVQYRQVTGDGVRNDTYHFNNSLPSNFRNARLDNAFGRGQIKIINRQNGEVVVRIQDPQDGASDYRFTLRWDEGGGNGDNPQFGINTPNNGNNNGGGSSNGTGYNSVRWQGQVEGVEDIHIVGNNVTWNLVTGTGSWNVRYNQNGRLPARSVRVTLTKRQGRGNVYISEQPSYDNNYICTVRIVDRQFGAGQYDLTLSW